GVRNLGLTWNFRNDTADGVMEGPNARGLSEFGVRVVEECNRLGIIIDVSHLAAAGVRDVLQVSQQPVIASHSNARALFDHYRNLTDSQIAGIVAGGGLIGVTFVNAFLHRPAGEATIEHVLDQIDYLVRTAGPDHVTIGSDFDGATMPAGLEDATRYPALTVGMATRGHSEETIRKVLGLNFLRVFEQVTGR
ncbi:MAG: membrane dipeptidase, partial [Anaerolineae bacterium]|nr:membrane dipeptidase [Anaerolineae bacterium]